jgi:hypothetical protein
MPLFQVDGEQLDAIAQSDFESEKRLQQLIEKNLVATFNCRFIGSEVSTGEIHRGRIDTLALSEENNPVIIEYKKMRSPELFTQSFFYLGWLRDHKGDFEVLVRKALGGSVEVDWSDIRVICLARDYSKYERVAIREMGGNIELCSIGCLRTVLSILRRFTGERVQQLCLPMLMETRIRLWWPPGRKLR